MITPLKTLSYASGRPEIVEGNEMKDMRANVTYGDLVEIAERLTKRVHESKIGINDDNFQRNTALMWLVEEIIEVAS